MVSCSASGCSNRGEKGYSMKSFPRDSNIRKKWQENVNRIGWEPTDNSRLCEVHFLPEMWEKARVDGKKKLKWNAIPTIFPQYPKSSKHKQQENTEHVIFVASNSSEATQTNIINGTTEPKTDPLVTNTEFAPCTLANYHPNSFASQSNDVLNTPSTMIVNIEHPIDFHNYAQPPKKKTPPKRSRGVQANYESIVNIDVSPLSSTMFTESFVSDVNIPSTLNNTDLFKKIYQYQVAYTQLLSKVNNFKDQIKLLTERNGRLTRIAKKDRHLRILKHVFNDDQICALEKSRFMKWSQGTLINALRLKNYCGKDGYEEILRQKIPLPSIRTLNRVKITDAVYSMLGTNHFST